MQWKKYAVQMELTGMTRKKAAELTAAYFGTEAKYSFDGDQYTIRDEIGREWKVTPAADLRSERMMDSRLVGANHLYQVKVCSPLLYRQDFDTLYDVLKRMEMGGGILNETTKLSVLLEAIGLENREKYVKNLESIHASKGNLLQKALEREFDALADCSELEEKGLTAFPVFSASFDKDEVLSCVQFSQAVSNFAANRKSISSKEKDSPNEKFTLRTWLVQIGFVGDEYKFARKMLTENLEGNSAWLKKTEQAEAQQEQQQEETEQENEQDNCSEIIKTQSNDGISM